ncbi:hypothetical protein D9M68_952130 [compost metagenome]
MRMARAASARCRVLKWAESTWIASRATSWRISARHCVSPRSEPMPKVLSLSWPYCVTFSVTLPRRMSMMWPAPNAMPLDCCTR